MCGITGIKAFNLVGQMFMTNNNKSCQTLKHRGPDSMGFYADESYACAHTRLSIQDLSISGKQPMKDESERYVICFNGEIYNFKALRQELISNGIEFKSDTDTEVLLQLFIKEGKSCLNKLNGFFAFAIYDKENKSLFIARDRFGIKPLFYYHDEDKFAYASELKALMAYNLPKVIDKKSLNNYLHLNYIPAPNSIFENVYKLLPGHCIELNGRSISIEKYYNPEVKKSKLSYENAGHHLRELMDQSVEDRLISDASLGSFLSGGIDSSIIAGLASEKTSNLKTFSIGFKDNPFFDETHYAEVVAEKFKTDHTTFKLSNDDLFDELEKITEHIDEPFADSSAVNVHILSRKTREQVTVALSGDGADELFAGYNKYKGEYLTINPGFTENIIKAFYPLLKVFPKSRNSSFSNKIRQIEKYVSGSKMNEQERYWNWCGFSKKSEIKALLHNDYFIEDESRKKESTRFLNHSINGVLLNDQNLVLVNDMLVKVDKMSMANGLEVRVPFLDHLVVEFANSLPDEYKINGKMKKRIVQDAFRDFLPQEIYNRPKKGFEVPMLDWLKTSLQKEIRQLLLDKDFITEQGVFNHSEITSIYNKLMSTNPGDAHARIWGLLVFQKWWKQFMN